MMKAPSLSNLCVFLAIVSGTLAYKHVVFMHGILAGPEEWPQFQQRVEKYHPGTPTTIVDMFNNLESAAPLWYQVHKIADSLAPILTNKTSDGTILICFSQGGLICRGLLSILKHNVETFISLSSPLAGQFGDTDYLKNLFPTYLRDNTYKVLYTKQGQLISVGNYWYDPYHLDLYSNCSAYLGLLNNQTFLLNPNSTEWKSNFLRLKNLILVGGPDDGVITPWQSSHFGMYNSSLDVLPMQLQPWYINDSFGLKTLNERGGVLMKSIPGIKHTHWHTNADWYINDSFGLKTLNERGGVLMKSIPGIKHTHWHTNDGVFDGCIKPWLS